MKRDTITWKEAAAVHLRAWKEIRQYCPGVFPAIFLYGLLSALSPYVSLFLSAQLLNELSGAHRPEILGKWAIAIIALTALLSAKGMRAYSACPPSRFTDPKRSPLVQREENPRLQ